MIDSQQFLFRCNPEPMWVYDRETLAFLAVNEAAVRRYGYSEAQFLAMTIADIRPAEDLDRLRAAVDAATESPNDRGRWFHRTSDGGILIVEVRTFGLTYKGRPAEIVTVKDVTELVRLEAVEEKARWSQKTALELLGRAGRVARFGGWRMDLATGIVTWSDETAAIHDEPPGVQVTLEQAVAYHVPEHRERVEAMVERCRLEGVPFDEVLRIVTAEGRSAWVRVVGAAERDSEGRIVGLSGACQDINELVEARNRSETLEQRLREILDATGEGFMVLSRDWRIVFINRSAAHMLQRSVDDLLQKRVWDEFPQAVGSLFEEKYTEAWETGGSVVFEAFYDALGWFEVRAYPSSGGLAVHFQNVTARKQAQAELEASEERFRLVADGASDVIWDFDFVADKIWWSEHMARRYGHDVEAAARHSDFWLAHIHPDDRARVKATVDAAVREGARGWNSAYRFMRADGGVAHVMDRAFILRDAAGAPLRMLGNMTDVTERIEMETRLRESQKIEALGRLTGGVAHDFNNLLTVIIGGSEELMARAATAEDRELARLNIVAASQGADLIRQLLAFARRQPLEARTVEVAPLLEELEPILRRSITADVELVVNVAPDICPIHVDPAQLEAALLNLVINARDAMSGGGKLAVTAGHSPGEAERGGKAAEGVPAYVAISVSDTGCGMTPEVQRQAFEPFFTTKGLGEGAGLGLSMVYGFVTQSKGRIELESRPGQGARVTLLLPCAQDGADADAAPEPASAPRQGGNEKILVVEDDPLVREHVGRRLAAAGYSPVCTPDARTALERLEVDAGFDLLFTDLIMPGGMDGRALAREARRRVPGLKVLFTSGYVGEVYGGERDEMDMAPLLQKPYRQSMLITSIREALDGRVDNS